jgi:outer membrane immunogenic protein
MRPEGLQLLPNRLPAGPAFATPVSATGTQPFHNHGFTGGLQVGFNYQYQWAVMGVEADFESFKTRGSANQTGTFPLLPLLTPCNVGAGGAVFGGCQYGFQEQSDGKWLTTVRGKVGAVWGNWLLYGTMGVAVAKLSFTSGFSAANCFGAAVAGGCDVSAFTVEQTKVGVAGGGGLSYMITRNWIASVEYLRVEIYGVGGDTRGFNTQGFLPPGNFTANFHYDTTFIENIVRFKLDYKL